jgi:hypothetical protein
METAQTNVGFCVLLTQAEQRDPLALAKALAAIRKTPVPDQSVAAKNCWGLFEIGSNENSARELSQGLTAAGISNRIIPSSRLAPLPDPIPLDRFDGLSGVGLILIAAAGVTVTHKTTRTVKQGPSGTDKVLSAGVFLATGIPIKFGPKEEKIKKEQTQSDLVFYVDLLYQNPPRRLRIDALHFDYSFLKERKQYHVQGNFKLLLGDIAKLAPEAWRNHGTRLIQEGLPLNRLGYSSLTDLERETRWLLTLHMLS